MTQTIQTIKNALEHFLSIQGGMRCGRSNALKALEILQAFADGVDLERIKASHDFCNDRPLKTGHDLELITLAAHVLKFLGVRDEV